jgi:hypothetical protein
MLRQAFEKNSHQSLVQKLAEQTTKSNKARKIVKSLIHKRSQHPKSIKASHLLPPASSRTYPLSLQEQNKSPSSSKKDQNRQALQKQTFFKTKFIPKTELAFIDKLNEKVKMHTTSFPSRIGS